MKVTLRITGTKFEASMEELKRLPGEVVRTDGRRIAQAWGKEIRPAIPKRTGALLRSFRPTVRKIGTKIRIGAKLDRRKMPALWGWAPSSFRGPRTWQTTDRFGKMHRAYDRAYRAARSKLLAAVAKQGARIGVKQRRLGR